MEMMKEYIKYRTEAFEIVQKAKIWARKELVQSIQVLHINMY